MNRTAQIIFGCFALVVLLDLFLIFFQQEDLRWYSKPLLMPMLTAGFLNHRLGKKEKPGYLIPVALFLSWCGDILLQAGDLFIPGLVSFLAAHVVYSIYFSQTGNGPGYVQRHPLLVLPVLLYLVAFVVWLFPFLGDLKVPVIIYSIAIGTMLLTALNTRNKVDGETASRFVAGALLFVVSDSLLAVNLFVFQPTVTMNLSVMATYAAAQYLIVRGSMK